MGIGKSKVAGLRWWIYLGMEFIFYPVLFLAQFGQKYCRKFESFRQRKPVETPTIYIEVHEWGGYPMVRYKKITKSIPEFECGLKYQLERFNNYTGYHFIDLTVTMSDFEKHSDLAFVKSQCADFIPVSNAGMDFSGYEAFYEKIKMRPNSYVLLSNSSISSSQCDFLDSYIDYMEANPDVGILGISCCSKCYQTLIRNNFMPHLQSFFLLTTIEVLDQIVEQNGGSFPGSGIENKRLLIREGEIRFSQKALKLGYKLAVVADGVPVKFDNCYKNWSFPFGDYRCYTQTPNTIHPIHNKFQLASKNDVLFS